MLRIIFILTIFLPFFLSAQSQIDFTETDQYARETPDSEASSIEGLAGYLTQNADTDLEKVRALFVWMTENIRYDTKLYFDDKAQPEKRAEKQEPEKVLKYKKGVCEGYTNLFHELCRAAEIPSEKVTGYTKTQRGRVTRTGHTWNVVRIGEEWFLIDNTWGAGYVDNEKERFHRRFEEKYFLAKPETFVLDHYPNDPLFQLLPNPVTWEVFQKEESAIREHLDKSETPDFGDFRDSLDFYHALPVDDKAINSASRTLRFDPKNSYANFMLANHYYDEAKKDFDFFVQATEKYVDYPQKLEERQIEKWARGIEEGKSKLKTAKSHLEVIESGNKFYRQARQARKHVNTALVNFRNAEIQLGQFRDYLRQRGN